MAEAHCRIVRVRPKASPHLVVHRPFRDSVRGYLSDRARRMDGWASGERMAGFVMVSWTSSGQYAVGYEIDGEIGPVSITAAPSFVGDVVRREITAHMLAGTIDDEPF